jgi:murein DD-endopeptidase MepM/ murein hydrolase activator NlpD
MSRFFKLFVLILILFAGSCTQLPANTATVPSQTRNSILQIRETGQTPAPSTPQPTHLTADSIIDSATVENTAGKIQVTPAHKQTPFLFDSTAGIHPFFALVEIPIASAYQQEIDESYPYGSTQNGTRIPHDGVELTNDYGTPVLAAQDGTVLLAGNDKEQKWGAYLNYYGNLIILQHENEQEGKTFFTLYAHLSEVLVESGQKVATGQEIGKVGTSGGALGSHLHFEIRIDEPYQENTVNPALYMELVSPADQGALAGRVLDREGKFVPENTITIQPLTAGKIDPLQNTLYIKTYAQGMPDVSFWQENFAICALPAGEYRVTTYVSGEFFEEFISIEAGKLTYINFQPK